MDTLKPEIARLIAAKEQRRQKLDAFLDAYSLWRRTHATVWRIEVERLAQELRALDADFAFHFTGEPYW